MSSFRLSDEGGRPTIKEVKELERECEKETLVESEGLDQQGAYLGRPQLGDLVKVHYIGRFLVRSADNRTDTTTNHDASTDTHTNDKAYQDEDDMEYTDADDHDANHHDNHTTTNGTHQDHAHQEEEVEYTSTYQTDRPLTFTVTDSADEDGVHDKKNMVLRGMKEGVKLMNLGETARLRIPPELGYGTNNDPPCTQFATLIPPNSTLVLQVELLQIYRNGFWYRRNVPKKIKRNKHANTTDANHQSEPHGEGWTDRGLVPHFKCCPIS